MRYDNQTIALADIDEKDVTYRITTEANDRALKDSIKHFGVLNSPIIIKNQSHYTIISGFRRIEACRRLGIFKIDVKILDPATNKIECARLAITDNAMQRPLNLVEKSRSIKLLSALIKDENILLGELAALGLPANASMIKKLKEIVCLSRPVQDALLSGTISFAVALEMGSMAPGVAAAFVDLFEIVKLSLNKQREIITLATEIALREDVAIPEILEENRLQEILKHPDLDRNQKAQMIRLYLKKRRFPAISTAEKAFEQFVKTLKLKSGIKLVPPRHFEGSTYNLVFTFKQFNELKDHKTAFDALLQHHEFKKKWG